MAARIDSSIDLIERMSMLAMRFIAVCDVALVATVYPMTCLAIACSVDLLDPGVLGRKLVPAIAMSFG
jgi:hypothetical protein